MTALVTTHGLIKTRAYLSWAHAKARCCNPNVSQFKYYGGRGIKMCDRWLNDYATFFADMGERPTGATLERLDNNGDYAPDNCVWASRVVQANNKRSNVILEWEGQRLSVTAWERALGFKDGTLKARLYLGWSMERALTTPVR